MLDNQSFTAIFKTLPTNKNHCIIALLATGKRNAAYTEKNAQKAQTPKISTKNHIY